MLQFILVLIEGTTLLVLQVSNNRSNEVYVFNHESMARRALKNLALGKHIILS